MEIRQVSMEEILSLATFKLYKKGGGRKVVVYIPPQYLPPLEPFRTHKVSTLYYGEVRMFIKTSPKGGWEVYVQFPHPLCFNPALPPKEGAEILKKMKQ